MADDSSPRKAPRERAARLTPDQRRQEILEVATRLIAQSGFNAVSQADIAEACGVGKSLVTHYFSSMKALLAAVLEAQDLAEFTKISDATFPRSEPDQVRAFFTRHMESNMHRWEAVRLHRMLDAEALDPRHPAHDCFVERYRQTRRIATRLLAFKKRPDRAAQELLAFWHGLELEWGRDRDFPVMTIWNGFADRFFVSIEPPASASRNDTH